jgi:hypothetical protein
MSMLMIVFNVDVDDGGDPMSQSLSEQGKFRSGLPDSTVSARSRQSRSASPLDEQSRRTGPKNLNASLLTELY